MRRAAKRAAALALLLCLGCTGQEEQAREEEPAGEAMAVDPVPGCDRSLETRGVALHVVVELADDGRCADGTLTIRARWESGGNQTIALEGMGFPTDLWIVDLGENGTEDLLIGHQDLTGEPPRVHAFEEQEGTLRDYRLAALGGMALLEYEGGGNFFTRGGQLFFSFPVPDGGSRTLGYTERTRTWSEVDAQRLETDRPREPGVGAPI